MQAIYVRELTRAAEMLGGPDALALYLNAPAKVIDLWLAGAAPIPHWAFDKVVEALVDRDIDGLPMGLRTKQAKPR
jgi:hypothetical protein